MNVGVLGCGVISRVYLERLTSFDHMKVVACADMLQERAAARAEAFGVPMTCTPEELVAHPDVDVVVNLTIPAVHAALTGAALDAGKHVYSEKPIALTRADAQTLVDQAGANGVLLGSAPDTFLGAGLQTCRALIDAGAIGEPVAATALRMGPGPEAWHPDPAFLYQRGAGPLFDVGVYDVTALVALLGPVRRVSGSARKTHATRTIGSEPLRGSTIDVEVPTHVAATLDMAAGPVVTLVSSFDVAAPRGLIEVYGTEGTISVPDPNTFGGVVRVQRRGEGEAAEAPIRHRIDTQARGVGVADLVQAVAERRAPRASGAMALHVVDVMQSICEASDTDTAVALGTTCERPASLPEDWDGN